MKKMIVVVEELNIKLYKLFVKQLTELNIGYDFEKNIMQGMMDLVNAIDYIRNGHANKYEIHQILGIYEEQ